MRKTPQETTSRGSKSDSSDLRTGYPLNNAFGTRRFPHLRQRKPIGLVAVFGWPGMEPTMA